MKIIQEVSELRSALLGHSSIGFVPTMGAFHGGHLALMKQARSENKLVVVSLFVNPTQFAPTEDLANYPRPREDDICQAESEKVDILFEPSPSEIYKNDKVRLNPVGAALGYEGESRPGHFAGVATVVAKLFNVVNPSRAYFGLKDLQQCAVIKQMVESLLFPVDLRFVETIREPSGLALSSRNQYLSETQKIEAAVLSQCLFTAAQLISRASSDLPEILRQTELNLSQAGFLVEYLAAVDPHTMQRWSEGHGVRLIAACKFHGIRLLDNVPVPL